MKTYTFVSDQSLFLALFLALVYFQSPNIKEVAEINTQYPVENALKATVKIQSIYHEDGVPVMETGSGAFISEDGLIVTNYHVIDQAEQISVLDYTGKRYEVKVLKTNPQADLALIKIQVQSQAFFTLGQSKRLKLGEVVFAIGSPLNLDFSLTSGIVGAFDRQPKVIAHSERQEHFIQTDVPINSGCSGGPLLNAAGELVGINTAIASKSGRFEGYSFAIPAEFIQEFLQKKFLATKGNILKG